MKYAKDKATIYQADASTTVNDYHLDLEKYEVAPIEVDGVHGPLLRDSIKTYYILEGELAFDVEGEKETCYPGDIFHVEKQKTHTLTGKKAKAILISSPPYVIDLMKKKHGATA